jgi:cell wall-associated NlpC family hydrolase
VTRRTLRGLVATLSASLALTTLGAGQASAHERGNFRDQRHHIETRARSQAGKRYTYGGETPRRGFDCSGFTSWVFGNHGARLPRTSQDQFRIGARKNNKRIWKRRNLRVGDLVFFKTTSRRVGHAGIYVGNGRFISSTSSSGVRVDSVYDRYYWGRRWVGAVRHSSTRWRH